MGACDFYKQAVATSARAGFNRLVENARDMYGYDSYNGTISTTFFKGVYSTTGSNATKTSIDNAYDVAEKRLERLGKWNCEAIDCGVDHYEVITMKKDTSFKSKGAPKYAMRFVLVDWSDEQIGTETFSNQTEAKNALMKMFAAGKVNESVRIAKKSVLISGDSDVARFNPVVKTYKTKPKSVPAGAILKEFHTFVYFGWAGC